MNTEKLRDFANRLILWSYDYEQADKAELNELIIAIDGFVKEFNDLLREM